VIFLDRIDRIKRIYRIKKIYVWKLVVDNQGFFG